jgi:hypothetical protein
MKNVRETSIKALRENRIKLGHSQMEVFRAFLELGPMHDARIYEYLEQREKLKPRKLKRHKWENSNICGRRNQLIGKGVMVDLGSYRGIWNGERKTYHLWAVWNDERPVPAGWERATMNENSNQHSAVSSQNAAVGCLF